MAGRAGPWLPQAIGERLDMRIHVRVAAPEIGILKCMPVSSQLGGKFWCLCVVVCDAGCGANIGVTGRWMGIGSVSVVLV